MGSGCPFGGAGRGSELLMGFGGPSGGPQGCEIQTLGQDLSRGPAALALDRLWRHPKPRCRCRPGGAHAPADGTWLVQAGGAEGGERASR